MGCTLRNIIREIKEEDELVVVAAAAADSLLPLQLLLIMNVYSSASYNNSRRYMSDIKYVIHV